MSSDGPAVQVAGLGKMYRIYDHPVDRLKQMLWGRWRAKPYGSEFWALQDFACRVPRGSMLGIIGRNGSGKSTLLQLLAGTLTPTTGTVVIKGRVSALLELGSGFNPEFSGLDNVLLAGAIIGIDGEEMRRRLPDIIDFAGIGDFIHQPVKTYSSGMAVRLAFSVASSVDPDILIIDEALAVGDLVFQQRCFQRFRQIREGGTTVIFVTHDLGSVIQYCDQAIVLDRGRMLGEGSPKAMVDLYKRAQAEALAGVIESAIQPGSPLPPNRNGVLLRDAFQRNPNAHEFGDGAAIIEDWGLCDDQGRPCRIVQVGDRITFLVYIIFHQNVPDPIASFTIRDLKGVDLTGTNTWFADRPIGSVAAGDRVQISFSINISLAAGNYSLSTSCTEITSDGLSVHHRLYDIMLFEVLPDRRFVGIFNSHVEVVVSRRSKEVFEAMPP